MIWIRIRRNFWQISSIVNLCTTGTLDSSLSYISTSFLALLCNERQKIAFQSLFLVSISILEYGQSNVTLEFSYCLFFVCCFNSFWRKNSLAIVSTLHVVKILFFYICHSFSALSFETPISGNRLISSILSTLSY